jgi:hypothetical protein
MVVVRAGRAQERRPTRDLVPDFEAENLRVEVNLAVQSVHVEDGVVQAADWHRDSQRIRTLLCLPG